MERKWTYFISSTFLDLREERKAILNLVLKLDEIPIGMEQFGAVDTTQWEYIKKLIDTADYYILVVAGRYGTVDTSDPSGISYTEKEYNYAKERKVPIIAILHESPGDLPFDKSEITPEGRERLARFRTEVESGRLVSYYRDQAGLVEAVASGVIRAKSTHPRPGWVRKLDNEVDQSAVAEIASMRAEILRLKDDSENKNVSLRLLQHEIAVLEKHKRDIKNEEFTQNILLSKLDATTHVVIQYVDDFNEETTGLTIKWLDIFLVFAKIAVRGPVIMAVLSDEIARELCRKYSVKGPEQLRDFVVLLRKDDFDSMMAVFSSLELIYIPSGSWGPVTLTAKGKKLYLDQRADAILSSKLFD